MGQKLSNQLSSILKGKPQHRLREILEELDWSGAELSRRIGKHQNTVTWWMTNPTKVPTHVLAYLELVVSVKRLADTFKATPRKRRKKA